jgi:SAM-dependent methyltransferase
MDAGPALVADYDSDPGRFAANQEATARYSLVGDVHPFVAARFAEEHCQLVLDVGGGNGTLGRLLLARGIPNVTIDHARHVRDALGPAVRADAVQLPFPGCTFPAAAALFMLYHLEDPATALEEIRRVLRPGGLVAVCAPSRFNDPELADVLPRWGEPRSFDAENGPRIVTRVFGDAEVETWDAPMVSVPDQAALALFLRGRFLPEGDAQAAAGRYSTPLQVTKRGMLAWARK